MNVGIIGLGLIGGSFAKAAAQAGHKVHVWNRTRATADRAVAEGVAQAVLEDDIGACDVVVVAIGSNMEASMMATANCKELGVPNVVSKATSELHGKILRRIGADSVVYPDRDSAHRLARAISNHDAIDFLEVSEGYSIAEVDVPESVRGKTLAEADLRKGAGLTVLCIRRADPSDPAKPRKAIVPKTSDVLQSDDKLIVFGETKKIDSLQ